MNADKETFVRDVDKHLNKLLDSYRTLLKKSQNVTSSDQQNLQFQTATAQLVSDS
jgi:hypothetical protein